MVELLLEREVESQAGASQFSHWPLQSLELTVLQLAAPVVDSQWHWELEHLRELGALLLDDRQDELHHEPAQALIGRQPQVVSALA